MSDDEQKLYPWQEGLPTKPDVDLLLKTWPEPKIGDRFEYETVETLLRHVRGSSRFKSITAQWRKRLHERGFVIECEAGAAFFVATAEQVSAATYGTLKFIGRKARRHRAKLSITKPVDDAQRGVIEHQARLMNAIEKDSKKARMNLLPTAINKPVPQIAPPREKGK